MKKQKQKKLQYVSDIHLEFRKGNTIPTIQPVEPGNTYLALCGDIGNPGLETYKKFLDIHSPLYVHILIVAGNHEYYSSRKKQRTIDETDTLIGEIVKGHPNITYLNMNGLVIGRTKFIGCPLWSDVTANQLLAEMSMNDYKNIYVTSGIPEGRLVKKYDGIKKHTKYVRSGRTPLRATHVISMHRQMREWLEDHSKINPEKYDSIIVLTHHAPTFSMLPKLDEYSYCYGSNCDDIIKPPITHWISGHTHGCMKVKINGVTCLSNCMGYPSQNVTDYKPSAYIEFA